MAVLKKVFQIFSVAAYCITCLYFCLFAFYNSTRFVHDILRETAFAQKALSSDERLVIPFLIMGAVGYAACVLITALFKKSALSISVWGLPVLGYALIYANEFVYIVFGLLLISEIICSIILIRKELTDK